MNIRRLLADQRSYDTDRTFIFRLYNVVLCHLRDQAYLIVFSGPGRIFHFTTGGLVDTATNEIVVSAEGSTFFKRIKSNPLETSSGRSRCLVVVSSLPFPWLERSSRQFVHQSTTE